MDNYLTNDEQIQIILRNYQKNKDLEDYAIDELAKRLKNIKTKDEIVKRLKETNYMGTYVVGDSIINDSESEEKDIVGRYYNQAKIIAVSKSKNELRNELSFLVIFYLSFIIFIRKIQKYL